MTFGRTALGDLELMQASFSGFSYPGNAQVVPLLGDGTTPGGNAVMQQSALTLRQAVVSWLADGATDVATARGYYESKETITYTDHNGTDTDVVVLEFSSALRVGDFWDCTATIVEVP